MVFRQLFPWHLDAFRPRPQKWHQNIYTTYLHKRKNFKTKLFGFPANRAPSATRTPSTVAAFQLPRCFSRAIQRSPITMHSSGENSRKRKNDSDKRGGYRKFDKASSRMRPPPPPRRWPSSICGAAADCHLGSLGRSRALLHPSSAPADCRLGKSPANAKMR